MLLPREANVDSSSCSLDQVPSFVSEALEIGNLRDAARAPRDV